MALAIAAGVFAWRSGWLASEPEPAPHPLTLIEAADIVSVDILTSEGALPLTGGALVDAAGAIAALKGATVIDGRSVTWGSATMLRATTRDGVALSLQVKRIDGGAAVRVTADAQPGQTAAGPEAAAIRSLRHNAYKVGPKLAAALGPQTRPDLTRN